MDPDLVPLVGAAALVLLVGFLLGRYANRSRSRIRDLASQLEGERKEREFALAEAEVAKDDLKRKQKELDEYTRNVVDHFTGTSELMRDLTLQYRAVYDHLHGGAAMLCPEGSIKLEGGAAEALPPVTSEPTPTASDSERAAGSAPDPQADSE